MPFLWSQSNDSRVLSEECPGALAWSAGLRGAPGDAPSHRWGGGGLWPLWFSGSQDALW